MSVEIVLTIVTMLLVVVVLMKSLLVVQENQRVVVIKLGKIEHVLEPGLNFVLPFVDMPVVVNLDAHIPTWSNMSSEVLNQKLVALVRQNPNPKLYK